VDLTLAKTALAMRKSLGLKQLELADLSGCGPVFVYALESGKPTLRLDKLVGVLTVLGLRLSVERRRTSTP
jgi:HTH-type transcriptional regulator / antitoxin HipB